MSLAMITWDKWMEKSSKQADYAHNPNLNWECHRKNNTKIISHK